MLLLGVLASLGLPSHVLSESKRIHNFQWLFHKPIKSETFIVPTLLWVSFQFGIILLSTRQWIYEEFLCVTILFNKYVYHTRIKQNNMYENKWRRLTTITDFCLLKIIEVSVFSRCLLKEIYSFLLWGSDEPVCQRRTASLHHLYIFCLPMYIYMYNTIQKELVLREITPNW